MSSHERRTVVLFPFKVRSGLVVTLSLFLKYRITGGQIDFITLGLFTRRILLRPRSGHTLPSRSGWILFSRNGWTGLQYHIVTVIVVNVNHSQISHCMYQLQTGILLEVTPLHRQKACSFSCHWNTIKSISFTSKKYDIKNNRTTSCWKPDGTAKSQEIFMFINLNPVRLFWALDVATYENVHLENK